MGEICKRGDDGRNQKTLSLPPPRSSRTGVGDVNDNDGVGVGVGDVDDMEWKFPPHNDFDSKICLPL